MSINDLALQLVNAAVNRRQDVGELGENFAKRVRSGEPVAADVGQQVAMALRDARAFEHLADVARELVNQAAASPTVKCLLGQALIEQGGIYEALAALQEVRNCEPEDSEEWAEATGLMGRAFKDALLRCDDLLGAEAREHLRKAITYYDEAYNRNPDRVWQGLNALALRSFARRIAPGLEDGGPDPRRLIATLTHSGSHDRWYHASMAEAHIPLGAWDQIEQHIGEYARDPETTAFQLSGTLRQFSQLWRLADLGSRGQGLVDVLRAALLAKEEGYVRLEPDQFQRVLGRSPPADEQIEAVLGNEGPRTYAWWKQGVQVALSVVLVRQGVDAGVGTGFIVRGGDLAPSLGDELLVLTNAHVVSEDPNDEALHPSEAKIAFQDVVSGVLHDVAEIVWSSSKIGGLDASLLRLLPSPAPGMVKPLRFARVLPALDMRRRVYVIGHPNGGELAISLHDNELIGHEGPPSGNPPVPSCRRVHYRAPTELGNSGSPVFNSSGWEVIALHHKGGKAMPQLNGQDGLYEANEGIWIQSIVEAVRQKFGGME